MDKNKGTVLLLICLIVFGALLAACSQSDDAQSESYVFGSGAMGSFYYTSMEAFSTVINSNLDDVRTSTMSTNGGVENVLLLFDDKIEFAALAGSEFALSYEGADPFKEKYEPVQVLTFGLAQQLLAVREKSGIDTIYDLEGKNVAIGPSGSSAASTVKTYMDIAGVDFKPVYLSHEEGKDAFIGGTVDAAIMLFMNNEPYPTTMQAEAAGNLKYLEWDSKVNQKLINQGLGYVLTTLPKGQTDYITQDYEVFSSTIILGTRADISEEVVYKVVKALAENNDALLNISSRLSLVTPESLADGFIEDYHVHKGTAKYLKELDLWDERFKIAE